MVRSNNEWSETSASSRSWASRSSSPRSMMSSQSNLWNRAEVAWQEEYARNLPRNRTGDFWSRLAAAWRSTFNAPFPGRNAFPPSPPPSPKRTLANLLKNLPEEPRKVYRRPAPRKKGPAGLLGTGQYAEYLRKRGVAVPRDNFSRSPPRWNDKYTQALRYFRSHGWNIKEASRPNAIEAMRLMIGRRREPFDLDVMLARLKRLFGNKRGTEIFQEAMRIHYPSKLVRAHKYFESRRMKIGAHRHPGNKPITNAEIEAAYNMVTGKRRVNLSVIDKLFGTEGIRRFVPDWLKWYQSLPPLFKMKPAVNQAREHIKEITKHKILKNASNANIIKGAKMLMGTIPRDYLHLSKVFGLPAALRLDPRGLKKYREAPPLRLHAMFERPKIFGPGWNNKTKYGRINLTKNKRGVPGKRPPLRPPAWKPRPARSRGPANERLFMTPRISQGVGVKRKVPNEFRLEGPSSPKRIAWPEGIERPNFGARKAPQRYLRNLSPLRNEEARERREKIREYIAEHGLNENLWIGLERKLPRVPSPHRRALEKLSEPTVNERFREVMKSKPRTAREILSKTGNTPRARQLISRSVEQGAWSKVRDALRNSNVTILPPVQKREGVSHRTYSVWGTEEERPTVLSGSRPPRVVVNKSGKTTTKKNLGHGFYQGYPILVKPSGARYILVRTKDPINARKMVNREVRVPPSYRG